MCYNTLNALHYMWLFASYNTCTNVIQTKWKPLCNITVLGTYRICKSFKCILNTCIALWSWIDAHTMWNPGGWFNIKMTSYQYRKSHCGDTTILRPFYLHNGISYTGKMSSVYWIRALAMIRFACDRLTSKSGRLYLMFFLRQVP